MYRNIQVIIILVWCLTINIGYAEEKWVADEIFLQMSDMRKEIQQLQKKVAGLEQKLADAQPKLVPIPLAGTEKMSLGKQNAALAILEFSDYECPYCAKHYLKVLPKLQERYIDKGVMKYVMKDFPLEFHAHARKASLSARCAGDQGYYWPMHNAIFDAHGQATDELIDKTIKQLKLDSKAFKQCLENPVQLTAIEKDMALGVRLGVNGTPAFLVGIVKDNQLINYKRLDGVQSFETFVSVIESFKKQQ
jgi:protein-disulfide isomerase